MTVLGNLRRETDLVQKLGATSSSLIQVDSMAHSVKQNADWQINNTAIAQVFDLKRIELQLESAEEDCFCPNGRTNWIHYSACTHRAGINDRQKILQNLMWYADELCAKVAIECTPEVWLAEEPHGCYAPPKARWDAYFTPVRKTINGTMLTAKDILHWDVDATSFEGLREIKTNTLREIKTNTTNIKGYEMVRKLYAEGTPFVWQFDVNYWSWMKFVAPKKVTHRKYSADTCGVADLDTSVELLNIGQLMLQELNIEHSDDFVTIHLRRGDYMKCDTQVKTVINYLECSIGGDDIKKVLVLTNGEKDYLKELQEEFSKAFPTLEMISLDNFIESESFVEKLNQGNLLSAHTGDEFLHDNCFRFSAQKVLVSMARYHLERGRIYCKGKCDRGGVEARIW